MDCGLREKNAVRRADRRTDVISRPDWTGMGMSKRHKGSMVSNSCNGHTERSSESGEEVPQRGTFVSRTLSSRDGKKGKQSKGDKERVIRRRKYRKEKGRENGE